MIHYKRIKISEKRSYVINLSLEEIETIINNLPRHPRDNKKEYNIVNRLRRLKDDNYRNKEY